MIAVALFTSWITLDKIKEYKKWIIRKKLNNIIPLSKYCVKSLTTVTRNIQITGEFQFHYLILMLIIINTFDHASIMTSIPTEILYY